MQKLIQKSKEAAADDDANQAASGVKSLSVTVPLASMTSEERKDLTMDELLAGYEEDLGIQDNQDIDNDSAG